MLRAIVRRKWKCVTTGVTLENLFTILVDVPEVERAMTTGGFSETGYDVTELVGIEIVSGTEKGNS